MLLLLLADAEAAAAVITNINDAFKSQYSSISMQYSRRDRETGARLVKQTKVQINLVGCTSININPAEIEMGVEN